MELSEVPVEAEFMWSQRPSSYIMSSVGTRTPEERMGHTATQIGRYLYIFGGIKGETDAINKKQAATAFNNLYVYDLERRVFLMPNVTGEIPKPRFRHSAAVDEEGNIYVFGGVGGGDTVHRLKTYTEPLEWDVIPTRGPAPKERDGHFSCVYKSKLYVIGGRSLKDPNQLFSDVVSLDLTNFFWEVKKTSGDGPVNTWLYSAERIQNILYLIGSDFRPDYGQVMFLDLNSMAWDEKKV